MGSDQVLALIETDQAAIARAQQSLGDLQVIGLILCHQRWTVELAERYQADIQDIDTGLAVTRRWTAQLRKRSTRHA